MSVAMLLVKGGVILSVRVLQINCKFSVPSEDLQKGLASLVGEMAAVPGLRWKIWNRNEQAYETGGL